MGETMNNEQSIFDLLPEDDKMKNHLVREKSIDWKWNFADYPPKNGLKVFSCFACGGGSTMGYNVRVVLGSDPIGLVVRSRNFNFCAAGA